MPLVSTAYPGSPWWLRQGHLETLYPALYRKVGRLPYERERITTPDDDFLDLDWLTRSNQDRLVVLSHGLEGHSYRPYILGMASRFYNAGWDVLAWNCRSCSGEMNKQLRLYHHGDTEDIHTVVSHAFRNKKYETLALVGFSLGGSISLNYTGRRQEDLPDAKVCTVALSVPLDLGEAARKLDESYWSRKLYRKRFQVQILEKARLKQQAFPDKINLEGAHTDMEQEAFDTLVSAQLIGFKNATDFYNKASSKFALPGIQTPTLILQAANDPILGPRSMDRSLVKDLPKVALEITPHGGHVGWYTGRGYYSEDKTLAFCEALMRGQGLKVAGG